MLRNCGRAPLLFSVRVGKFRIFQCGEIPNCSSGLFLCDTKVVKRLQIKPKLRASAKKMAETESGIARNGARSVQDLRDAIRWHADFAREFSRAHREPLRVPQPDVLRDGLVELPYCFC